MADYKNILVCGEITDGELANITTELLGCGRNFADELNEELICFLASDSVGEASKEAIAFGADKVYTIEDPLLKDYQADAYMQVIEKLIKELSPRIVLIGETSMGRDLSPRLAFRFEAGLTTDCIELAIDPDSKLLLQTRSVFGGIAEAVYTCELMPQIASVRQKTMSPIERDESRSGEVISFDATIDSSKVRTKISDMIKEEITGIQLEDAAVVIGGGRGIGAPEPFTTSLQDLADVFTKGGFPSAVGASRPACDSGWLPASLQVGLTGKIIAPDLYIAIGISGASQHITGVSGSKTVVAINRDPDAYIFKVANFGIVDRYENILPALTEKLQELLAG